MAGCPFLSGMAGPYDGFVFFGKVTKMNCNISSLMEKC